jgi:hypothetical protein
VITLLADANVEGHVSLLVERMRSDYWREFWDYLEIRVTSLRELGLPAEASDADVWHCCQRQQSYLLTNNRNDDKLDSLESTIRLHSTAMSLPIFTFSNADEILRDSAYVQRVIESLFDYLLRIDTLRGTGRIYLP